MIQSIENNHPLIPRDRRAIIVWLTLATLLVAAMVLIGGYTRLSGAGLSITQWKPVHGTLPPLNEADWNVEFSAYKTSPQYSKVNAGMTLEAFKTIFWPEYIHRLLARAIGFVMAVPLAVFLYRKSITVRLGWRLAAIIAFGGLQGLIGWLMVASGLVDQPYVSPLRLSLHLLCAFAIFAFLLWTLLDIIAPWNLSLPKIHYNVKRWFEAWLLVLVIQLFLGAFMAGTHAGLIFNTWPKMDGQWLPAGLLASDLPALENIPFIQFAHRTLAAIVAFGFLFWWYYGRGYVKNAHLGKACAGVTLLIAIQFALGVLTLLHQVPLSLALAHQMVALLLFAASVILLHGLFALRDKTTK